MDAINWESLNWLDIILGGTVIISALVGITRGFLKEVLSLLAWAIALYCAYTFSDLVAKDYISKFINDASISYLAAFGGIFLTCLFLIGLLNLLISLILKATGLGFTDRILGLFLGIARGAIISALIVFMISFVGNPNDLQAWRDSQLKRYFIPIANWGLEHLPKQIKDKIDVRNDPDKGVLINSDGQPLKLESLRNEGNNSEAIKLESTKDIPEEQSGGQDIEVKETPELDNDTGGDDGQGNDQPLKLESYPQNG